LTRFWKDDKIRLLSEGHAIFNKYFEIKNEQDYIRIIYSGIFGLSNTMQCYMTQTGLIFSDEHNRGVEIIKHDNLIQVLRNNKVTVEYEIQAMDN
jgi:hypothetical protein